MMSSVTLASIVSGVEPADGAAPAAAPVQADSNAFASAFDALFADVALPAPAVVPNAEAVAPGRTPEVVATSLTTDLQAAMPDPFALLGIPLPAQPPSGVLAPESAPWRRPTPDRIAVAASIAIGAQLDSAAALVEGVAGTVPADSGSLQAAPPALHEHATEPDALAALAAAGNQIPADPRSGELASVDLVPTDGVQPTPAADPAPVQRQASEPAPRALPPPVTVPLQSPDWNREFAARVNWMVERGEQFASIRLTPEQLGPVEVRLAIREGEASIWFGAAQADTRAAIEQALPRLREMLAASGLALADSGVFQGSPRDPRHGLVRADARRAAGESDEPVAVLRTHYRRVGLIDDYA